jgi:hypothetical protein
MLKKFSVLLTLSLIATGSTFASSAFASDELSECGLPKYSGSDLMIDVPGTISLNDASKQDVQDLDSLSRQQLFLAGKILSYQDLKGTWDAVVSLREASEANDLAIAHFRVGSQRFTQVIHYPGGNPVGVIFKKGTRTAVAVIGDSDIDCL